MDKCTEPFQDVENALRKILADFCWKCWKTNASEQGITSAKVASGKAHKK